MYTECIQPVYKLDTQNSIDKNSIDKISLDKTNILTPSEKKNRTNLTGIETAKDLKKYLRGNY